MTRIKFCGMTREEDLAVAIELGVDAVGFVLWPGSPRRVDLTRMASLVRQLPPTVTPVGVMVSPSDDEMVRATDAGARVLQLHGVVDAPKLESCDLWFATSLSAERSERDIPEDCTILVDAYDPVRYGGTGRTIDWKRAAELAAVRRVMLAGGLTAANVGEAIHEVRPYGVDVASGIEDTPGVKNAHAMRAFVAAVREADR
jgi:phosphoribosylanthranilate isomerase